MGSDLIGSGGPPRRRPSLRGALMMDISGGNLRARAWPTHRKRVRSAMVQGREEHFANVQRAWNYYFPDGQRWMQEATGPTPMLPRDMWTMMIYNRLFAFQMLDGRTIYPMPAKLDVERSLDAITQTPGEVLRKTATGWEGTSEVGGDLMQRVNTPRLTDFPFDFAPPGINRTAVQLPYGISMERPGPFTNNVRNTWMIAQAAPEGNFEAVMGFQINTAVGLIQDVSYGIGGINGNRVTGEFIGLGNRNTFYANQFFNGLNAVPSLLRFIDGVAQHVWFVRLVVTALDVRTSFSWDGGYSWSPEITRPVSVVGRPTHIGPVLHTNTITNELTAKMAFHYWRVS